jgi:hypothetical protein
MRIVALEEHFPVPHLAGRIDRSAGRGPTCHSPTVRDRGHLIRDAVGHFSRATLSLSVNREPSVLIFMTGDPARLPT